MNNELPQTATEYLTLAPSTQTQIDVFSDGVIQSVQAGEVNPLTVLIQLRAIAKASERILKEINSNILNEAGKYSENEFEYAGCKLTKAEHGTTYDFSNCGDIQWVTLKAKESILKSSIKDRETFLKAIKGALETLDKDSGEVVTLTPPTKKSTSGVNVSIR
jgi:hypothetical protein